MSKSYVAAHVLTSIDVMCNAPKDRHALAKIKCFAWNNERVNWDVVGFKWVEVWFNDGQWRIWCGNPRTMTTETCDIVDWRELEITKPLRVGAHRTDVVTVHIKGKPTWPSTPSPT